MNTSDLRLQVVKATQEFGISSVLFRNTIGRKLGLNITDIGCLNYLFIKGSSTPTKLAHYTGLTTGSTTTMLDRLEKMSLITRKPNPIDRRGLIIEINQEARKKIIPMVAGAQKAQSQLFDSYSDKELLAIADFLTRFTNNVTEQSRKIEGER